MADLVGLTPEPDRGSPAAKLLVVDDDRMQRLVIATVARRVGCEVDEAGSFEEAIALLSRNAYGRVVVDLSLGDGDGIEVIRHIAATGSRPRLLVLSGFDGRIRDAAVRFARNLGLTTAETLRKPIDVANLRMALSAEADVDPLQAEQPPEVAPTRREMVEALDAGEIVPFFQPKVSLATRRIIGAEALARWTSPRLGPVPPQIFAPLAEEWGLSPRLTHAMLTGAAREAASWPEPVGVAVNIPAGALTDLAFPERVMQVIDEAGLAASRLTMEVTESTALSDDVVTGDVLTRLRIKGVKLSLDDFGTGYSSLSSLLSMPFCELKIDRSFVRSCDRDRYAWKIVRATLSLAREFGMATVAEGIETEAVATMVAAAGCDAGQGYLFSRALPARAFRDLVNAWEGHQAPAGEAKISSRSLG